MKGQCLSSVFLILIFLANAKSYAPTIAASTTPSTTSAPNYPQPSDPPHTYPQPTDLPQTYPPPKNQQETQATDSPEIELPKCLNSHPPCCQDPYSSHIKICPLRLCILPLCNDEGSGIYPDASSPPKIEKLKKAYPINPETVGNIPSNPKLQWREPSKMKYNKCFSRFEIRYKNKCENYDEENCYTKHEETCENKAFRNCGLVPKETHERKCQPVNEQVCHLKKTYKTEQVVDYTPKQKCHKTTKRLCDTIWQFDHSTRNDFLCKQVAKPKCTEEWTILYDKTCQSTYRFECGQKGPYSGYGDWALNSLQQVQRHPNDQLNQFNTEIKNDNRANHFEKFKCRKIPKNRCYKTSRRVKIHKCEQIQQRQCEKVTNPNPRPVQHQSCHDEPYEECEVEKQHQLKMVQVPVYTEDCKIVPRQLCDNQGETTLKVKCVNESKPICKWRPKKVECHKTPRQHCYTIPYQEKTTDCDEHYQEDVEDQGAPYQGATQYSKPYSIGNQEAPYQGETQYKQLYPMRNYHEKSGGWGNYESKMQYPMPSQYKRPDQYQFPSQGRYKQHDQLLYKRK